MGNEQAVNTLDGNGRQTETLKFDYDVGKFYIQNHFYIESGSEMINHGTYSYDKQSNTLTINAIDWITTAETALDLSSGSAQKSYLNLSVLYDCSFYSHSTTNEAIAIYFDGDILKINSSLYGVLDVGTRSSDDRVIDKVYGIKCTGQLDINDGNVEAHVEFGLEDYGIYADGGIHLYNANVLSNACLWPMDSKISYGIYSAAQDILIDNSNLEIMGRTAAAKGSIKLKTSGSEYYRWWYIHGAIPPYNEHVINYGATEGSLLKDGVAADISDKNYLNFLPTRTAVTNTWPGKDGSVCLYHKHSNGSGVPFFIMPVHFSKKDLEKGGKFHTASLWAADLILKAESFEGIWDYLDIYIYLKSDIINPVPQSGYCSYFNRCYAEMKKILLQLQKDSNYENTHIIYLGNCDNAGQVGGHAFVGRGALLSWGKNPQSKNPWEPNPGYWVLHEFSGHAFARFLDEYYVTPYWDNKPHIEAPNLYISPEKPKPQDVPWKEFIGFQEKNQKPIDIYGFDNYNAWRPCEDDCMRGNSNFYVSMYHKWVIYKKVMEIAKTPKTLEDFCRFKNISLAPFNVAYSAHVKLKGWLSYVKDGEMAGTTGESRRLEAVKIRLENCTISGAGIQYRVHVKEKGWMPYVHDDQVAGTTGESRRAEAIQIKLVGLDKYSVEYRVHMKNNGWSDWVRDGAIAGTTGESRRIEAVEIRIMNK